MHTEYKRIDYEITDSTNLRAKEYARECREKIPTVFVAKEQTSGRGRLGRSFHSPGGGIYLSFLLYPDTTLSDATKITACAAVKVCRAIGRFCDTDIGIKWVNDLFWGGKKLAGILTEGVVSPSGELEALICGIGLNLYKTAFPEQLSGIATSIEDAVGRKIDREEMIGAIIDEIFDGLDPNAEDVRSEYRRRLFVLGKTVTVVNGTDTHAARITDLLDDYSLLAERDGKTEIIRSGEISIRF